MKTAITVARYLLGAALLIFGLNGFLGFIPQPAPPEAGGAFLGALADGGVMPLVKVVEILTGALLLAGRFVPLALIMLVPVMVGIVLYHVVFDIGGGAPGYVFAALTAFLVWSYRSHMMSLLRSDAQPLATA